jgi:hypothetical protein
VAAEVEGDHAGVRGERRHYRAHAGSRDRQRETVRHHDTERAIRVGTGDV